MTGRLKNSREFLNDGILSVGTSDFFSFKKIDKDERLVKSKIGVRSSKSEDKDIVHGFSILPSEIGPLLFTISKIGALYRMKNAIDNSGNTYFITDKNMGYLCLYCLCQKADHKRLNVHIMSQHVGPVKCKMCYKEQLDVQALSEHIKSCSYDCGVEGCTVKHKRLIEAQSHMRKYLKSIE